MRAPTRSALRSAKVTGKIIHFQLLSVLNTKSLSTLTMAGNADELKVATELQIATEFIRKVFEYTGKEIRGDFKCPPDMEIGSGLVEPRYAVWPDDRDLEMEYWIKGPFAMFEKGFQEKAFHLRETYDMV